MLRLRFRPLIIHCRKCSEKAVASTSTNVNSSLLSKNNLRAQEKWLRVKTGANQAYSNAYEYYIDFFHMRQVREAFNKVEVIQDELRIAQETRRQILHDLTGIRADLAIVHGELMNCSRTELRYLDLVRREQDILRREKEKQEAFQVADTAERELFTHLTAAVRTSHEKEKVHGNAVKYWSIIGSVVGALVGIIGTAITNHYRNMRLFELQTTTNKLADQVLMTEIKIMRQLEDVSSSQNVHYKQILKAVQTNSGDVKNNSSESWGSYLKRHSLNVISYCWPWYRNTK